jgi:uncharacterized membrane protein HdeD (DUF308 family)
VTHTSTPAAPVAATAAPGLRRLYLARFGFALVWAVALVVLAGTAPDLGVLTAALLVIYPAVDVAAAVVDVRSSRASRIAPALHVNTAISAVAAVALAVAATAGVPAVLQVWGVWAVVAGVVQLVVALRRRALGGQWAMIASGALSTIAGTAIFLQAAAADASLTILAGYALLGGIFFLVSALRLRAHRSLSARD